MDLRPHPKLTCRAPVDALRQYVPRKILEKVRDTPNYERRSDAVVTTSARAPSANANRQDCIKKVHDILRIIAKELITEASRKPPKQLYVVSAQQDSSSLTPISDPVLVHLRRRKEIAVLASNRPMATPSESMMQTNHEKHNSCAFCSAPVTFS